MCLLCCLPLLVLPSPPRDLAGNRFFPLICESLRDVWAIVRRRSGLLALILCFLPVGVGASSGLWAPLAPEWGASPNLVALVTGVVGGLVSAAGCVAGGFICDRYPRQGCYLWFGVCVALAGVAFALLPRTPVMFTACTLVFSFATGLSWAGYTAFVLEAIGKGAAATKFSAFASFANIPIAYMGAFNGMVQTKWNTTVMLCVEAAMGVAGAVLFVIVARWLLPSRDKWQSAPETALPAPEPAMEVYTPPATEIRPDLHRSEIENQ
jgi:predicted MFS family arabinose efflux permease